MANPHMNVNIETVTFEKFPFGASAKVSLRAMRNLASVHREHALGHAEIHQHLSPIADELLLAMSSWILKNEHFEKEVVKTVDVPATWWDHLKHYMLASPDKRLVWVAKLFTPPRYTAIVQIENYITRVCPHNDTYFSGSQQHMHWLLQRYDSNGNIEP